MAEKMYSKAYPPTWGDFQRMAAEIKRTMKNPAGTLSGSTFYALVYLESIVVDDGANKNSPFQE